MYSQSSRFEGRGGHFLLSIYLVLGCIEAEFYVQIFIFQHFSRSTRSTYLCTAPYSKFADFFEIFVKKWWIFEIFAKFLWNLLKSAFFRRNFNGFLSELREMLNKFQKCRKKCRNLRNCMKNDEILQIFLNYLSIYDNWPLPPSGSFGVQNETSALATRTRWKDEDTRGHVQCKWTG